MRGTLSGLAAGHTQAALTHQRPNWVAIAANSFGSALGNSLIDSITAADRWPQSNTSAQSQAAVPAQSAPTESNRQPSLLVKSADIEKLDFKLDLSKISAPESLSKPLLFDQGGVSRPLRSDGFADTTSSSGLRLPVGEQAFADYMADGSVMARLGDLLRGDGSSADAGLSKPVPASAGAGAAVLAADAELMASVRAFLGTTLRIALSPPMAFVQLMAYSPRVANGGYEGLSTEEKLRYGVPLSSKEMREIASANPQDQVLPNPIQPQTEPLPLIFPIHESQPQIEVYPGVQSSLQDYINVSPADRLNLPWSTANNDERPVLSNIVFSTGANGGTDPVELSFDKKTRTWTTPGGLDYGQGSIHGNRVQHVLDHTVPNMSKPTHTIFNVERNQVLGLIDEAWKIKTNPLPNDAGAYVVPMGRAVGTAGETNIKIVVRPGTNQIITAYPQK